MIKYIKNSEVLKSSAVILLLVTMIITVFTSCSRNGNSVPTVPKTYVLIHGAWQGAWVWQAVQSGLESSGQKVIVIELPAHGDDNTLPVAVSLNVYRDKVVAAIKGLSGRVILVGHSMGGMVITAVAEAIPDRIEKLVYIGAFLPADGQSLASLAGTDALSLLGPNLIPSSDQLTLDIKRDQVTNIFCQDGSDLIKNQVISKFKIEPAIPFGDKLTLTSSNFGQVDKYYIHTLQDHAVGIDLQYRMVKAAGITKTYSLDSGHCPFLTMPDKVISTLLGISK